MGIYCLLVSYLHRLPGFHQSSCRIVVYSPQIYENYILQSGEGLSVLFVVVWLLGDLTNLAGAILANLLPTVIFLGVYVSHSIECGYLAHVRDCQYTICDITLLGQIYYYRRKRNISREDQEPLLRVDREGQPSIANPVSAIAFVIRYAGATCLVFLIGIGARSLSAQTQPSTNLAQAPQWLIQSLGWTSATLYVRCFVPTNPYF